MDKKHYTGHRKRLKERFLKSPMTVHDYEIYEMWLFYIYRRIDVKPLAKTIMKPAICDTLSCTNEKYIHITSLLNRLVERLQKSSISKYITLESYEQIQQYCNTNFIQCVIRCLWFSQHCELLGETILHLMDEASILADGIKFKAFNVVIVLIEDLVPGTLQPILYALESINIKIQDILKITSHSEIMHQV